MNTPNKRKYTQQGKIYSLKIKSTRPFLRKHISDLNYYFKRFWCAIIMYYCVLEITHSQYIEMSHEIVASTHYC